MAQRPQTQPIKVTITQTLKAYGLLNIGSLGSDRKQCDFLSKLSMHLFIDNSGHVTNNVIINFASMALYVSHKVALSFEPCATILHFTVKGILIIVAFFWFHRFPLVLWQETLKSCLKELRCYNFMCVLGFYCMLLSLSNLLCKQEISSRELFSSSELY